MCFLLFVHPTLGIVGWVKFSLDEHWMILPRFLMMDLTETLNLLMFHPKMKANFQSIDVSGWGFLIASRRSQVPGSKHLAVSGRIWVVLNPSTAASML
jgi:hypothetical protein